MKLPGRADSFRIHFCNEAWRLWLYGGQRLYGVDLMALVSYDQVAHEDDNNWSLGYLTIVGAYVLKGTRHDVSTLVDLAVVDPVTHFFVLRAGGSDTRHGNVTLVRENVELRDAAHAGFDAATQQMMDHFDQALRKFESDVHEGTAHVKVVSNHGSGGGGEIDGITLAGLLTLVLVAAGKHAHVKRGDFRLFADNPRGRV